jgi:hypothetical protein
MSHHQKKVTSTLDIPHRPHKPEQGNRGPNLLKPDTSYAQYPVERAGSGNTQMSADHLLNDYDFLNAGGFDSHSEFLTLLTLTLLRRTYPISQLRVIRGTSTPKRDIQALAMIPYSEAFLRTLSMERCCPFLWQETPTFSADRV